MIASRARALGSSLAVLLAVSVLAPTASHAATVSQWATSGVASDYYDEYYTPAEATGEPNATGCDRGNQVWATVLYTGTGDLTLTYAQAVVPSRIKVYQNNVKGAITRVDVSADGTTWTQVYTGDPTAAVAGICHAAETTVFDDVLDIPVTGVSAAVRYVKVSIDQDTVRSWAEIDAVQLISGEADTTSHVARRTIGVVAGSSVLTKKMKATIRRTVALAGTDARYIVTGAAGRIPGLPTWQVRALAKHRADKVRRYLVKLGVRKSTIKVRTKIFPVGVAPKIKLYVRYQVAL